MNFIQAVWYLRENGAEVKPSGTFSRLKRMYFFTDTDSKTPVMLLTCGAVVEMATILKDGITIDGKFHNVNAV